MATALPEPSPAGLFVEGYADRLSLPAGDGIGFHVSTNLPRYSAEIARLGARRKVVWARDNLLGACHPVPANASSHGCGWPPAFRIEVPHDWSSGYYSLVLRGEGAHGGVWGEISFVVRAARPGQGARILLQRTTNTDAAYNSWGGYTLYSGPDGPAHRVSFDRPYAGFDEDGIYLFSLEGRFEKDLDDRRISDSLRAACRGVGIEIAPHSFVQVTHPGRRWYLVVPGITYTLKSDGRHLKVYDGFTTWESGWRNWEQCFVAWAERSGYRLEYAVNTDLEFCPEILRHYRLVLSVGHDEYWSAPMRDHLEQFVAGGGNAAFFSGNNLWWQVRSEDKGRALVCWKDFKRDPYYASGRYDRLTTLWCHHLIGRPENRLTGVSFARGGYHDFFDQYREGPGHYTVHRSDHWVFEGAGLGDGDPLGGMDRLVGYECDGCDFRWEGGRPVATGREGTPENFTILATAPAALSHADESVRLASEALYGEGTAREIAQPGAAVMGLYSRGGTVFTTGCTEWAKGLRGRDKTVERITRNLLDRLSV